MRTAILFWLGCWSLYLTVSYHASGQADTVSLPPLEVSGRSATQSVNTSLPLHTLEHKVLQSTAGQPLSYALRKVPGVDMLTTGSGIATPVIHGLYGNRILVLIDGLPFDNQQWQDEHGLGLTGSGLDHIEVVEGPLSALYGSGAMGGLIDLVTEEPARQGHRQWDISTGAYSNDLGLFAEVGMRTNRDHHWWRVRGYADSHADYQDGHGTRILNTRHGQKMVHFSYGEDQGKWQSEFNCHFSHNQAGFLLEDSYQFISPDGRWSRSFGFPHHTVLLNLVNGRFTRTTKNGELSINTGVQHNWRRENESGARVSLNMVLLSGQYELRWKQFLSDRSTLILVNRGKVVNNTNYGGRILIPDAWMAQEGLAGFYRYAVNRWILELGGSISADWIKTLATKQLNPPSSEVAPFNQLRWAGNGLAGITWQPAPHWKVRLNGGTGYRAPNLAELSSNGLHEGTLRYELGDPGLTNEFNTSATATINRTTASHSVSVRGFVNRMFDYIYLNPTGAEYLGFQVYRFKQQDALLRGGEAIIRWSIPGLNGLNIEASGSLLRGTTEANTNLPFISPAKIRGEIRYEHRWAGTFRKLEVSLGAHYAFAQQHPATDETATPGYTLVEAGISTRWQPGSFPFVIALTSDNLLNVAYVDHLSRYKPYGLLNQGRDIALRLNIPLIDQTLKNQ